MTLQISADKTNAPQDGLDPTSIAAIRELLAQAPKAQVPPVLQNDLGRADSSPHAQTATAEVSQDVPKSLSGDQVAPAFKGRFTGYRPKLRHLLSFGAIALLLFRPVLVIGLFILSLMVLVGVVLIVGYDVFWIRMAAVARWYAGRNPEKAAAFHGKLDRFAMKWDSFLDRFPEGSVDGFYLPDLNDSAAVDADHEAALDRRLRSLGKNS